jgi:hypothetical protein
MEDQDMAVGNSDFLVTETSIDKTLPVDAVVDHLRKRRVTGQLVFHLNQGGVSKVALVERTKARDGQREKIREILNV